MTDNMNKLNELTLGELMDRRHFLSTLGAAGAGLLVHAQAAEEPFKPLFDGKSLVGWHKTTKKNSHGTGGQWTVQGGVLVGEQDPPGSGNGGIFLTDEKFSDFELELEMNCDWGPDTGVFFRTTEAGEGWQMYVDYHDGGNVGHLRGEMPGAFAIKPFQIFGKLDALGKVQSFTTRPDPRAQKWPEGVYKQSCTPEQWIQAWRIGQWNHARIRCVGKYPQITTWINDLQICVFDGETSPLPEYDKAKVAALLGPEGSIGLQVHGGKKAWPKGTQSRWRNLKIRRL